MKSSSKSRQSKQTSNHRSILAVLCHRKRPYCSETASMCSFRYHDSVNPKKPVWWKVIVGGILMVSETLAIMNRRAPSPSANQDQVQGMEAMQVILVIVGIWLIWSGTKPLREKPPA
jgi:hypothetical protein